MRDERPTEQMETVDFQFTEDDFFVILPNADDEDIDLLEEQPMQVDSMPEGRREKLSDWRKPARRFYRELSAFARTARSEFLNLYPELRLKIFFNQMDLSAGPQSIRNATISVRSIFLEDRSASYPTGKQRFADLHIERTQNGYITWQNFFVGNAYDANPRTCDKLVSRIIKKTGGTVNPEVSCSAIETEHSTLANLEASDFFANIKTYLATLDRKYFLSNKIRSKLRLKPKVYKTEHLRKSEVSKMQAKTRKAKLPWYYRDKSKEAA